MNDLNPVDFILTPRERDVAALAAVELEAHRRRQNARDAMLALAKWRGDLYRPLPGNSAEGKTA